MSTHKYPSRLKRAREQQEQNKPAPATPQSSAHNAKPGEKGAPFADSVVARHYNARPDQGVIGRRQSAIIRMRNFNNWIKSVLIQLYVRSYDRVFDLCCGKGGDLMKYSHATISAWVGTDIAMESLRQCVNRYNSKQCRFSAKLICADSCNTIISEHFRESQPFDVVSCQFAFHYSFQSKETAYTLMRNATDQLKDGGVLILTIPDAYVLVKKLYASIQEQQAKNPSEPPKLEYGNSIYRVKFDRADFRKSDGPYGHRYTFWLKDAIDDCPEYLVDPRALRDLGRRFGLHVEEDMNFHEFFEKRKTQKELLMRMNVFDHNGAMSPEESDAIYLYRVVVFRKGAVGTGYVPASRATIRYTPVRDEDILVIANKPSNATAAQQSE